MLHREQNSEVMFSFVASHNAQHNVYEAKLVFQLFKLNSRENFPNIAKTRLFKYIENFTPKNWKFSVKKNSYIFPISAQNIDYGYWFEPPGRGGSKGYQQSMFPSNTRVMQKVLSLIGFLGFIPGIFQNTSLHLNGVLNS